MSTALPADPDREWYASLPNGWEDRRLGSLLEQIDERAIEDAPVLSVSIHRGVSDRELGDDEMERTVNRSEDRSKYKAVQPGDLVYNMMRAWQGGFGTVTVPGAISPAYVVARPTSQAQVSSRFLELMLRTPAAIEELRRHSYGITDFRLRLYWDSFKNIRVPVPPPSEQEAIVRYLDRETGRIDALVERLERLISLLTEKRQAVISHAVTKGLNLDAPMKDSGIDWLGEVPAHWDVKRLKDVTVSRCDGPFGSGIKSTHYRDAGARVIRLQNIKSGFFNDTDAAYIDQDYAETELSGHEVEAGDLLIAGLGDDKNPVGRACPAPDGIAPALVKADCFRFRLNTHAASAQFISYQLSAGADVDGAKLAYGTTRSRISLSLMATRPIVLPSLAEQVAVLTALDEELQQLDEVSARTQSTISVLTERRSALISAAVAGQIPIDEMIPDTQPEDAA